MVAVSPSSFSHATRECDVGLFAYEQARQQVEAFQKELPKLERSGNTWQVPGAGWAQIVAFAGRISRELELATGAKCPECLKGLPAPLNMPASNLKNDSRCSLNC